MGWSFGDGFQHSLKLSLEHNDGRLPTIQHAVHWFISVLKHLNSQVPREGGTFSIESERLVGLLMTHCNSALIVYLALSLDPKLELEVVGSYRGCTFFPKRKAYNLAEDVVILTFSYRDATRWQGDGGRTP